MIVLVDGVEYRLTRPENEQALETVIKANHVHIFGQDSLYFDLKRKIRSKAGVATIPDGYVIMFTPKPTWCIVEVELSSHPLYDHIVAQLTKFNRGIENTGVRRSIVEFLYEAIRSDLLVEAQVKRKIKSGEIYKFVSDVVAEEPTIVVVIDERTDELDEALRDIRGNKKVIEFKTYQRTGVNDPVSAYAFTPVVKCSVPAMAETRLVPVKTHPRAGRRAADSECLPVGLVLQNKYKGQEFRAEVMKDGQIKFNGQMYKSPSAAAVAAIRSTGSPRETEDGWRWWKFVDQETGKKKLIDALRGEHF